MGLLASFGCEEQSTTPVSGPLTDTVAWLCGTWKGECFSWQSTSREEEWTIAATSASQSQYYCASTHLIYSPRSFSSWRIVSDTLRFQLSGGARSEEEA
jgi:hypothetical protein